MINWKTDRHVDRDRDDKQAAQRMDGGGRGDERKRVKGLIKGCAIM